MDYYNHPIKEKYLESIDNEGSRYVVSYIFKASKVTEEILKKDLYNFSKEEVALVLRNMSNMSLTVAKSNVSGIRTYITWGIKNGYRDDNINPLSGLGDDWTSEFIDRNKKVHFSLVEFIQLLESLSNAQDQALLALLWEGITLDELRKIHYRDINWNSNEIKITERDGYMLRVNNRFMRYIENAYKQFTYITYKGKGRYSERELANSDFLFKNSKNIKIQNNVPVSRAVMYNRLTNIKEEFDLEYLTPNNLKQSGMIYMAAELWEEFGELEYPQFEKIGIKYQTNMQTSGEYTYYNTNYLKNNFITKENLKKLYDLDIYFKQ